MTTLAILAGLLGAAALTAWALAGIATRQPLPVRNHRGLMVTTGGGFAVFLGAVGAWALVGGIGSVQGVAAEAGAAPGLANGILVAASGAMFAILGLYDDLAADPDSRGWGAHLDAVRRLRPTAGSIKILGSGLLGWVLVGSASMGADERFLRAAALALIVNAANAFDLRPLRLIKAVSVAALGLFALGSLATGGGLLILACALACVPADRDERVILGDAGAFAFGGMIGTVLLGSIQVGSSSLMVVLAIGVLLNVLAVRPGISAIIDRFPPLREADAWGRRAL